MFPLLLALLFALGLRAETSDEARAVVKRVLDGLQAEDRKRADWTFTIHVEVKELDQDGRVKNRRASVFRQEPTDGFMLRRLIERDGKPIPERERKAIDNRLRQRAAELKTTTPEQIRKREQENAWFYELANALEFRELGEEVVDGRPATVAEMSPRPGYQAKNVRARLFEKMRGKILIDKADSELVRADVEVFDTVNVGFGLVGRINPGTRFHLERRRVAEGTWLTEMQQVLLAARMLMVKSFHQETTTRFSEFERARGAQTLAAP